MDKLQGEMGWEGIGIFSVGWEAVVGAVEGKLR